MLWSILRGFGASIRVGLSSPLRSRTKSRFSLWSTLRAGPCSAASKCSVCRMHPCSFQSRARAGLANAVVALGGTLATTGNPLWPIAQIGTVSPLASVTAWQLTWQGWRGGVVPRHDTRRLSDDAVNPLAAVMAAATAAAELFAWHANDHPMAGRRTAGLSLWNPGADWLGQDASDPRSPTFPLPCG